MSTLMCLNSVWETEEIVVGSWILGNERTIQSCSACLGDYKSSGFYLLVDRVRPSLKNRWM